MTITAALSENRNTLVIQVDDKFDFGKVQSFREAYDKLPDTVKVIEVDLSQTEYMDSSALGMLLNMQKSLSDRKIEYKITHCRAQVSRILKISRFDKKFVIA
ncbi:STAS domain-containing protein [Aestuariibacter sp. A3R04]|uniref:STAS domain-containing protein n=1 Tax=Aestuariibacter sp. A3R04 TaxID=2841571 RepID=UPI001C0A03DA|nr:STAS domain-containing protein [Aestuariibacter sp. A3R04]MBU3022435.1 STAS domain-containing protein [Aestuariibacter sp. A3R04]